MVRALEHDDGADEQTSEDEVFWEISRVFCDRDRAIFLVMSAGFPAAMVPYFTTPLLFWSKVLEEVRNGALADGVWSLVDEVARMYPGNSVFARGIRPRA